MRGLSNPKNIITAIDISHDDYDKWRYNYPKYDETSGYVKAPSQELSDLLVEALNKEQEE